MKTITLNQSLIENLIAEHFEQYQHDHEYNDKDSSYECVGKIKYAGKEHEIIIPYNIEGGVCYWEKRWISVHYQNFTFSIEDENLVIQNKNYNPNKLLLQDKIDAVINFYEHN